MSRDTEGAEKVENFGGLPSEELYLAGKNYLPS